jgi:hypothetical protein
MRQGPAALLLFLLFLAGALWQFVLVDICFLPYLLDGAGSCEAHSPLADTTLAALVLLAMYAVVTWVVVRESRSRSWLAALGNAVVSIMLVHATWLIARESTMDFTFDEHELRIVLAALAGAAAGLLMADGYVRRAHEE